MSNSYKKQFYVNGNVSVVLCTQTSFHFSLVEDVSKRKELEIERARTNFARSPRALATRAQFLRRRKEGIAEDRLQLKLILINDNP